MKSRGFTAEGAESAEKNLALLSRNQRERPSYTLSPRLCGGEGEELERR